jgi:hypothetical protein
VSALSIAPSDFINGRLLGMQIESWAIRVTISKILELPFGGGSRGKHSNSRPLAPTRLRQPCE